MPRAELHAHLGGCVPLNGIPGTDVKGRDLESCFQLFQAIRRDVRGKYRIQRVVKKVIENFADDDVTHLELRTTLKRDFSHNITYESYLDAILEASQNSPIDVKWILSIDRSGTQKDAERTVELAIERNVVGIEFSGNPLTGHFGAFRKYFDKARENGLKTTCHLAEIPWAPDSRDILDFEPDRVGHALFLSKKDHDLLLKKEIPVEVCLSSNTMTANILIESHPLSIWVRESHPFAICTDDTTIYDTNTTKEYSLAKQHFGLEPEDLAKASMKYKF